MTPDGVLQLPSKHPSSGSVCPQWLSTYSSHSVFSLTQTQITQTECLTFALLKTHGYSCLWRECQKFRFVIGLFNQALTLIGIMDI